MIGVIGFIGWRLYSQPSAKINDATSNNQSKTKTSTTSKNTTNTPPAQQVEPNTGYTVIKDWGVRFKPASSLTNIEYALSNSNSTAVFSTRQLTTSDANCSAQASGYSGIGSVIRTSVGSSAPFDSTLLSTINGYNYYYGGAGGASCITDSNNITGRTLMQNEQTDFSSSIKSLEAAQ